MRLQRFRLQKTQLGRKLLRICYSNLGCTPGMSGLSSRQWLWRLHKFGIGWMLLPLTDRDALAYSKQHVGRAEFCCPRMRGGVRVVPARGRGRIWLEKKARRELWQARTTAFAGTKETSDDCYFQDLSHLPKKDTDARCSGFPQLAFSPFWHRQGDNRTVGRQSDATGKYLYCQCLEMSQHQPTKGLRLLPLPVPFASRALARLLQ